MLFLSQLEKEEAERRAKDEEANLLLLKQEEEEESRVLRSMTQVYLQWLSFLR